MSSNPYAPPEAHVADPVGLGGDDIARLNRIAVGQRLLVCAVAVSIFSVFFRGSLGIVGAIVSIASLVLAVVGGVRLSSALGSDVWLRVIVGILMLVPLLNIIVMLVLSGRATRRLRAGGYKVGVFGARQVRSAAP